MVAFTLPKTWSLAALGDRFPKLQLQMLNMVPTGGGRGTETLALSGQETGSAVSWMLREGILQRGLILEQTHDSATVRLKVDGSPLVEALEATRGVPVFPFSIHGREVRWLLLDSLQLTRELLTWLSERGYPAHVIRSGEWTIGFDDMTRRQADILRIAMDAGFYEYPRRITLTELADQVGVSKSTLSEALMVIEGKVMKAHRHQGTLPKANPTTGHGRAARATE